jgi:hypothetical protein
MHQKASFELERSVLACFLLSNGARAVKIFFTHRLKALISRGCL